MTRRFLNPVVHHPEDYELTFADRTALRFGEALFFLGSVFARVSVICDRLGSMEGYWFYLADRDRPELIRDLLVPAQTVSVGGCRVTPEAVIQAAREVRARGMTVVAAGHSHGLMACSTSTVDEAEHETLCQEGVGWRSTIEKVHPAAIRPAADGTYELRFPLASGLAGRIVTDAPIDPDKTKVEIEVARRRHLSSFGTANAKNEYLAALFERITCPTCGRKEERYIETKRLTVHTIGPLTIPAEEERRLVEEVDTRVNTWSSYGYQPRVRTATWSSWDSDEPRTESRTASPESASPSPFRVRRGDYEAEIPASVLEEAAAHTPSLATALGWDEVEVDDVPA